MKLSNKTQALHDLIAPAVQACDVNLWGIEFIPQGKRSLLRIFIDKPVDETAEPVLNEDGETELGRGIGVQDCVRVTQQVGAILDVHDPISGEYALEVSSPGWDRPFFQLEQMSAYIGQQVALRLISAVENRRKFQAKLLLVDLENEMIQVEVDGKHVLEIDSHNIDKANLIYQD
ncbi:MULTISPECIES: ribosome maturation factor RimP [Acinetobacter]|uniref:Ribosome maturation factor RimP n=1 Tax=Acinetobacter baylyi (strain ATCC 33305 / BD413 / ADP1) TaxID=62977 RepID=RIMP_ACIAD|nr:MULTISPECIES: ribosome maturation factor RimP [Acinetobacter]Q6FF42.1 RecName: Full=Ribosome maturation factor RimP [Acinetobacter baylyi ADP1]ENV52818.1 ribosome maturation factor rimP [Acinetobacter baylyi DSM 14961 = CIP 107474]KAF2369880.1 ribosome assembly cofactor RimP [Acinetobacter baylyi]KAF2375734.1 ribosome assembly cofactor RimP [Acinetobacter baylyi]KAF2377293.1 ribosome assembly cofactor RimP [Acinetobacter baylyi]KAF2383402.1 ribosome assembly cofactor RimP [Acinetobacter ba